MRIWITSLFIIAILLTAAPESQAQSGDLCGSSYYFPWRAQLVNYDYAAGVRRLTCTYPRIPRWMAPHGDADLFCKQISPWPLLKSKRLPNKTRCVYWFGTLE